MSLEEKLGQLFMATHNDDVANGEIITLIKHYHISGVFLDLDDLKNREKISAMNRYLQFYASNQKPLFIATDQTVDITTDVEELVSMPEEVTLHQLNNRLYTKELAEVIGQEFREMGINSFYYPNLYVDNHLNLRNEVNPVARHGEAIVQGMKQSEVISFVTGFPSDLEIDNSINPDSRKSNLYPFYGVFQRGADVISIAEISERIIYEQIRTRLKFENVIVYELTDRFTTTSDISQHIIDAINNGANMIMLPFSYDKQIQILNKVIELAKLGEVDSRAINESLTKLFELKEKYNLNELGLPRRPLTDHQIANVKGKIVKKFKNDMILTD